MRLPGDALPGDRTLFEERRMEGFRPMRIEQYEPLIGAEVVDRIVRKARRLHDLRVIHVSSTFYGGGVAEILSSLTLLQRAMGIKADWRLIEGSPDFFSVTKKLHNALQGGDVELTAEELRTYEETVFQNALRMDLAADFVVVHDPQPLPLIRYYRSACPWVWRCHLDLSQPNPAAWAHVRPFIDEYDAVILSLPEYAQKVGPPQVFFMPAIDPLSAKNRRLDDAEIRDRLDHYGIPSDWPIITQISRYDRWKDPEGVVAAYRRARNEVDATLVLLGNVAIDDPEGQEVFEALLDCKDERTFILTATDTVLVNALQQHAAIVLQKSLREGFGLTVTEAMWKGAAVIGGRAGGIPHQIQDRVNGMLVGSVDEAAACIVELLTDPALRRRLGERAHETVREKFLMMRLAEQYLDLFEAFEPRFAIDDRLAALGGVPGARRGDATPP